MNVLINLCIHKIKYINFEIWNISYFFNIQNMFINNYYIYIRLCLLLLRLRLSRLYSLHSYSHFASEGWKVEMTRLRQRMTSYSTSSHFGQGKGQNHYNQYWTNINTRNGSASQTDELFRECLFNLGIMSTSILIQVH